MALNITQILQNLNDQMPALWKLVTGLTFFIGMAFGMRAMFLLKVYGDTRAGSGQADLRKPIVFLGVAAALLYSLTLIQDMLQTVYASSHITPYVYTGGDADVASMIHLGGNLVKWLGYIAFLRGWMLVVRIGDQGQQGVLGRAIVHIFAGILAINIFETWSVLKSILGL